MPHYQLFGLRLRSTIDIPELDPVEDGAGDAVDIRLGDVPATDPVSDAPLELVATAEGAVLTVRDVGRFRIREGREIVIDPASGASLHNLSLFLLGSAMGVVLHQRHILPLHANAIDVDGRALAFLGPSGAGKSTLAAAFRDGGRAILSDDVCPVTFAGEQPMAQPGVPRLRLWRDAIERSGRSTLDYRRAFDRLDKYTVGIGPVRAEALPLKAIFLLAPPEARDAEFGIRALAWREAMAALVRNTYRGRYIRIVGDPAAHLGACDRLCRQAPVFELRRPWDEHRIDETIARVEAHLAAPRG